MDMQKYVPFILLLAGLDVAVQDRNRLVVLENGVPKTSGYIKCGEFLD